METSRKLLSVNRPGLGPWICLADGKDAVNTATLFRVTIIQRGNGPGVRLYLSPTQAIEISVEQAAPLLAALGLSTSSLEEETK